MRPVLLGWILGIALMLAATSTFVPGAQPSALAQEIYRADGAARPSLGDLTIRPKIVHIGQVVTISGVTRGFVQFLPPFVSIESIQTHTVNRGSGLCGGAANEPIAAFGKPGGGSGGPGTRQHPPAGTVWKVRIRIPARAFSSTLSGQSVKIPTPPGRYRIGATGFGLDFCSLPAASNASFSVGYLRIVR